MSIEPSLTECFRPEERKRGEDLFYKDVVFVSSAADTSVRALIKASGAPRVSLATDDVTSPTFSAECSCPPFKKGVLCKHIWATLLQLESRDADFLTGKLEAEAVVKEAAPKPADRQKERYQQQKERAKEMRREQKAAPKIRAAYPEPVDEALGFFKVNGFDLAADLDLDHVLEAKRTLSRVFHPDKGGTHDEAIVLNQNYEILRDYLNG